MLPSLETIDRSSVVQPVRKRAHDDVEIVSPKNVSIIGYKLNIRIRSLQIGNLLLSRLRNHNSLRPIAHIDRLDVIPTKPPRSKYRNTKRHSDLQATDRHGPNATRTPRI